MDITDVAKLIPKEQISLVLGIAIVVAILSLVLYAIRVLYPILKKTSFDEIKCLAHSSVISKIEANELNWEDYENRLLVMEKNMAAFEEHSKRTDQRLDTLENSVKELTSTVLPLVVKINSIETVLLRMDEKVDKILWSHIKK